MSQICESVVISGEVPCKGCGRPIAKGQRLSVYAGGSAVFGRDPYHDQCHTEAMLALRDPEVRVGSARDRLTALRAQVQLGVADTDTLRTVLLALLDEVLR